MPELDRIDLHNDRQLDLAAKSLLDLGKRAIEKNSFGSLTVKIEWRANVVTRQTVVEESSVLTPVPQA